MQNYRNRKNGLSTAVLYLYVVFFHKFQKTRLAKQFVSYRLLGVEYLVRCKIPTGIKEHPLGHGSSQNRNSQKGDDHEPSIWNNGNYVAGRVPRVSIAVVYPSAPHARQPDDSDVVDLLRAHNDPFEPLLPCLGVSNRAFFHALHDHLYPSLHPNFMAHR